METVKPLPPSDDFSYLLTMIYLFSIWPEAMSLSDTLAKTACGGTFKHWITRYGYFSFISTDQGHQCEQQCLLNLRKFWDHRKTAPQYILPGTQSHYLKISVPFKFTQQCHETISWTEILPIITLGIRTAVKEATQASCSKLITSNTYIDCPAEWIYKPTLQR